MTSATSLYLLDTNAVSDVMADHPRVKSRLSKQSGQIVTCAIVRGEIRYGLERLPFSKRRTKLEAKAVVLCGPADRTHYPGGRGHLWDGSLDS